MQDTVLKVASVKKSFTGVKALKGVDLEIKKGEIHCLAGENGSGKTTLIKIVSGVFTIDEGHIEIDGEKFTRISPVESIMKGIQVIYQDFSIFPNMTVMENLAYNSELAKNKKFVNWRRFRKIAEQALDKIKYKIDLDKIVGDLPVAEKQLIAIARALLSNAKLIIMDEPTTALTKHEVNNLFKIILDLKKQGIAVLFVSHKLNELFEISERISIIRNGENIWSGETSELDETEFAYYMTGRRFEDEGFKGSSNCDETLLKVDNMNLKGCYKNISFELKSGEILGITGLLGSGRTELALSLYGVKPPDSGDIFIKGNKVQINNVQDAINNNIGYVPEDRLSEGVFLDQSIYDNICISKIDRFKNRIGFIDKPKIDCDVQDWVEKLSIATPNSKYFVSTLSGGNQQRVVLAKCLAMDLDILFLNSPTVGVDIGSKHDIHQFLRVLADQGIGIVIISDDIPEIKMNCSKIVIMKNGEMSSVINSSDITENELSERIISDVVGL